MTNTTPSGSGTISAEEGKVLIDVLTWNKLCNYHYWSISFSRWWKVPFLASSNASIPSVSLRM